MSKEVVKVKLTNEFKENALSMIKETIDRVLSAHEVNLSIKEKRKIKNLALDQLNVNVTNRINSKTLWVFNIENSIPVIVERDSTNKLKMGAIVAEKRQRETYKMKPNLTWSLSKKNNKDDGLTKKKFEEKVLSMILEDLETASFYGALSYVGDRNV